MRQVLCLCIIAPHCDDVLTVDGSEWLHELAPHIALQIVLQQQEHVPCLRSLSLLAKLWHSGKVLLSTSASAIKQLLRLNARSSNSHVSQL